jgi:GntR family transcriptional regulator/MocR family aminotransferase
MQFLRDGYYERHLNRMRTVYKRLQNVLIEGLSPLKDTIAIGGQKAGLHLLVFAARLTERELVQTAAQKGVGVYPLSAYYSSPPPETNTIVIGYAGYSDKELETVAGLLCEAWR